MRRPAGNFVVRPFRLYPVNDGRLRDAEEICIFFAFGKERIRRWPLTFFYRICWIFIVETAGRKEREEIGSLMCLAGASWWPERLFGNRDPSDAAMASFSLDSHRRTMPAPWFWSRGTQDRDCLVRELLCKWLNRHSWRLLDRWRRILAHSGQHAKIISFLCTQEKFVFFFPPVSFYIVL